MTNPIIPYSFVPGTKAKANEVNANFISLADSIAELNSEKLDNDLSNINATGLDFIKNNTAPARNIGEIVASTIPLTDASLHLLDGTLISGNGTYSSFVNHIAGLVTNYPDLFVTEAEWQTSVTDYGVCGKFVYDSVNNTVRLPKVTGILEGTTDVTALGDLVEAGLPNITGTFGGNANTPTGSFTLTNVQNVISLGNGATIGTLHLDASSSSSIYGNSTTVQPQTIKCYYYIVIATSTKTDIQVDIDEIATDLNGKMDTDLNNMSASQSAKNEVISWVIPDYSAGISMTVSNTSQTQYVCPDNGVITIDVAGWNNTYCYLIINDQTIFNKTSNGSGWIIGATGGYSVSKGDIINARTGYGAGNIFAATNTLKFFPLKGAN